MSPTRRRLSLFHLGGAPHRGPSSIAPGEPRTLDMEFTLLASLWDGTPITNDIIQLTSGSAWPWRRIPRHPSHNCHNGFRLHSGGPRYRDCLPCIDLEPAR